MAEIQIMFGFWTRVNRMKRRRCGLVSNYFDHFCLPHFFDVRRPTFSKPSHRMWL